MKNRGDVVTWPDVTDDLNVISQCAMDPLPSLVIVDGSLWGAWKLLILAVISSKSVNYSSTSCFGKLQGKFVLEPEKRLRNVPFFRTTRFKGSAPTGHLWRFFFYSVLFFFLLKKRPGRKNRGSTDSSDLTQFDSGWWCCRWKEQLSLVGKAAQSQSTCFQLFLNNDKFSRDESIQFVSAELIRAQNPKSKHGPFSGLTRPKCTMTLVWPSSKDSIRNIIALTIKTLSLSVTLAHLSEVGIGHQEQNGMDTNS